MRVPPDTAMEGRPRGEAAPCPTRRIDTGEFRTTLRESPWTLAYVEIGHGANEQLEGRDLCGSRRPLVFHTGAWPHRTGGPGCRGEPLLLAGPVGAPGDLAGNSRCLAFWPISFSRTGTRQKSPNSRRERLQTRCPTETMTRRTTTRVPHRN